MSRFSSKCDLYDQIYAFADSSLTELECFNNFKKRTGGVIYQSFKVNLEPQKRLLDMWIEKGLVPFIEKKDGNYYYYKEKITIKKLQKKDFYFRRKITFDTILDLVPYYGYVISVCCSDKDHCYVEISSDPEYVIRQKEHLMYSGEDIPLNFYLDELRAEYIRVVNEYYPEQAKKEEK